MAEHIEGNKGHWPGTAEEAIDAWKSLGDWQYADREAAWRWMFERGKEAAAKEHESSWLALDDRKELDPHIDGVVPIPMKEAEKGFLNGMLIGNLRRIYAAYDDESNDLSALPSKAAADIEWLQEQNYRLRETISMMISHCDERAKGWDAPKGNGYRDCEFGARHEARAIAAQLREMAALTPN